MVTRIAHSLAQLRDQVNELWPQRSKASDGWIGDTAHQARKSDHNANAAGVVQALDITHDPKHGVDTYQMAENFLAAKDDRIKYVISNRKIASGTGQEHPAWQWREYTGSNPHDQHIHISVKDDPAHYDSTAKWVLDPIAPKPDDAPVVARPLLQKGAEGDEVRLVQQAVLVDGIFGDATEAAVRAFQRKHGLNDDGIVGPYTWRALFSERPSLTPADWQVGITATVFGGPGDPQNSAYTGKRVTASELSVALPFRFSGNLPQVEVFGIASGRTAVASISDVGPWNTNDPYWDKGTRPQAESGKDTRGRTTNLAGIDLSPALARAVGIDGKGKVNWRLLKPQAPDNKPTVPPAVTAAVAVGAPVIAASAATGEYTLAAAVAAAIGTSIAAWAASKEHTMLFANWKTTAAGVAAVSTGIAAVANAVATGHFDPGLLTAALTGIFAGVGNILSKDFNITGGTKPNA